MATYRLKEWFLTITGTANKAGTRLKDGDKPNESTFSDWFKSSLFKSEPNDRAREDEAGKTLADINGHVVAATDAQAKANQAKKEDRTVVAQASQLPTNAADSIETQTYTSLDDNYADVYNTFEGETLRVGENGTTRNEYIHSWAGDFSTWFNGILDTITDFANKLQSINTQVGYNVTDIGNLKSASANFDQLLPVGATTFHINPAMVSDDVWKAMNGVDSASKYTTPGDSGSGYSTIYNLLVSNYALNDAADTDYFLLPDLSSYVALQDGNLGRNEGKWGGKINKNHLPRHQHSETTGYNGTLGATEAGSHTHNVTWSSGLPLKKIEGSGGNDSGDNFTKYDFQRNTSVSVDKSGVHTHFIAGKTGTHDETWGANADFTFTPPTFGGGYLIKVV